MSKSTAFTDEIIRVATPLIEDESHGPIVDFTDEILGKFIELEDKSIVFEITFNVAGVKIPPDDPRGAGNPIAFCVFPMKGDKNIGAAIDVTKNVTLQTKFSISSASDPHAKRNGKFTLRIPIADAVVKDPSDIDKP